MLIKCLLILCYFSGILSKTAALKQETRWGALNMHYPCCCAFLPSCQTRSPCGPGEKTDTVIYQHSGLYDSMYPLNRASTISIRIKLQLIINKVLRSHILPPGCVADMTLYYLGSNNNGVEHNTIGVGSYS